MSEKHTPGPWIVRNGKDVFTQDRHGNPLDGHQIADCDVDYSDDDNEGLTYEEIRANARLIAAAPAMYEALKKMLSANSKMPLGELGAIKNKAEEALALAEGGE